MKGSCSVCGEELRSGYQAWHSICKQCKYENASLIPKINHESNHQLIDEIHRENGLRELRVKNFKNLVKKIKKLTSENSRALLDVGCAHGWFLEAAKNDFKVLGLEPDTNIFELTSQNKFTVRNGFFPDEIKENERFDVITFNDVFEHIPNIKDILTSCNKYLNDKGLLVLNLPSSRGVFYKLSKWFCKIGFLGFFERLWQKDLPSPHLHYFNKSNLIQLLRKNGFQIIKSGSMPAIRFSGLYSRINYTGNYNIVLKILIYLGVLCLLPFLLILPKDAIYVIASPK
ncbi:class I SAM-dependent methyltransferase [Legionella waltersii]|uniref:3-demethylubiquinone-9 3-methyltransferase n=1 Tax=Legionella waltersii TaxID=66969 RepID=A0A0W1AN44_9GAMM|nr:class I SAM-dependent methyltransferase [Legionella waltersii]KTD82763.1 3-demethylubiquinone-9 3-methyltransferase [Legionella waltersii]SNV01164.1 3-demethylubiquinone-9 3-methyltransferase [Legionella waltersii]